MPWPPENPNVVLLGGVLQYLDAPYSFLESLSELPIQFLIIDRHPDSIGAEVITVQRLPGSLYTGSYPCWIFDLAKMDAFLGRWFEKAADWDGKDPPIAGRGIGARYVGQFWRRCSP